MDLVAVATRDANNLYKMMFRTITGKVNTVTFGSFRIWQECFKYTNIKY